MGEEKTRFPAWGVYDSYQNSFVGIPWLYKIPFLGYLFGSEHRDKVKSFFVIEVLPIDRDSVSFPVLDSLRLEDIKAYEGIEDSTANSQPDSVHREEN